MITTSDDIVLLQIKLDQLTAHIGTLNDVITAQTALIQQYRELVEILKQGHHA